MKKIAFIVLLGVFFTGCGTTQTVRYYETKEFWEKANVTYKKAELDYGVCQAKSKATQARETQIGNLIEACMKLDGYKWGKYKWKR